MLTALSTAKAAMSCTWSRRKALLGTFLFITAEWFEGPTWRDSAQDSFCNLSITDQTLHAITLLRFGYRHQWLSSYRRPEDLVSLLSFLWGWREGSPEALSPSFSQSFSMQRVMLDRGGRNETMLKCNSLSLKHTVKVLIDFTFAQHEQHFNWWVFLNERSYKQELEHRCVIH